MSILHFLNVNEGDCSIIQHNSGHVTVLDVCNASEPSAAESLKAEVARVFAHKLAAPKGNFNQKASPVNPIEYMIDHGISSVFRFILSHPDMDHMDGIKAFFEHFSPTNLWDTNNTCEKDDFDGGRYDQDDWDFYKAMRDGRSSIRRLALHSGSIGQFWNRNRNNEPGGDGLYVLSPTKELVDAANECDDYNDCSYVLLYKTANRRILLAGDSHDGSWEHILDNHKSDVTDVDLLLAPHHGRSSDRKYDFLDIVNPKMTYFGNARHEHLAYAAWNNRGLPFITNNQANCIVVETDTNSMSQYVTNQDYAEAAYSNTFYSERHRGWYIGDI